MPRFSWRWEARPSLTHGYHGSFVLRHGTFDNLASVLIASERSGAVVALVGWYWVTCEAPDLGIKSRGGRHNAVGTSDEAKAAALAYVRECLEKAGIVKPRRQT